MKIDVLSFTQNGKRTISFMSQALGLAADLDIGTDHLRWMGESRFMFGFLRGRTSTLIQLTIASLLTQQSHPIQTMPHRVIIQGR
jgi:diacylglycerol kinase family enzyme